MTSLLLSLMGCVPKGAHEVAVVQLEATRLALSARTAQCIEEAEDSDVRYYTLLKEIDARQSQLDELSARGVLRDEALASSQARILALIDENTRLTAEISALQAENTKLRKGKTPPPAIVSTQADLSRAEVQHALVSHLAEDIERQRYLDAREAAIAAFAPLVADGRAEVLPRGDHTVVRIPTALLFQEGFTTLSPRGTQIMEAVVAALRAVPDRYLTVEAHTDNRPVHTAELPSNWERGFSYAIAVLRALDSASAPVKLSAASFADTRPIVENDGPERTKNERIELFFRVDPELISRFAPTPAPVEPAPPVEPVPITPVPDTP